ncbi:MAG: 2OG-Fe dioxygenase family protein [Jatrophihabitantaceae bacterium]
MTATQRQIPASPPALPGIAEQLRREGYARYYAATLSGKPARARGLHELVAAFDDLPPDQYAVGSNRFRRYSQLVYLPWFDFLSWVPEAQDPELGSIAGYFQDGYNPDYRGSRRYFPGLPAAVKDNVLLTELIRANIDQVLWHEELSHAPIYVGVHLIKLSVDGPDKIAVSSPNCLHQDGGKTMFTFAHLITCDNVIGGENVIADPACAGRLPAEVPAENIHARFRLSEPMDSYVVHDHRVSHYVSPVSLADQGGGVGSRGIIIMGIAPFAPKL